MGTESTNASSFSRVIASHSSSIAVRRASLVVGNRLQRLILSFKVHYTFSIGEQSGEDGGQSIKYPQFRDHETASGCGQPGGVQLDLAGDRHNPAATVIALPKIDGNEEQYKK